MSEQDKLDEIAREMEKAATVSKERIAALMKEANDIKAKKVKLDARARLNAEAGLKHVAVEYKYLYASPHHSYLAYPNGLAPRTTRKLNTYIGGDKFKEIMKTMGEEGWVLRASQEYKHKVDREDEDKHSVDTDDESDTDAEPYDELQRADGCPKDTIMLIFSRPLLPEVEVKKETD